MAYTKQTWANGPAGSTPINATRLNYMETGIEGAHAPMRGTYGVKQTNIPSNTAYGISTLTKAYEGGGLNATVTQDKLTIPTGFWIISWSYLLTANTITGRNFLEVANDATYNDANTRHRCPIVSYGGGHDFGGATFLLDVNANAGTPGIGTLRFTHFANLAATSATVDHRVRLTRISS